MEITNYFELKQELTAGILTMVRENPGLTYDQIAGKFGVSRAQVSYRAKRAGIRRPKGRIPQSRKAAR